MRISEIARFTDRMRRVDGEISTLCGFWHRNSALIWPLFGPVPGLELLSLFHQDGFVRQAALEQIEGPLTAPFWFAAVAYRLNDWAEPVRTAAYRCAERCFPQTHANVIAEVAPRLLERTRDWKRWTNEGSLLDAAFGRADVADALSKQFATAATGPLGRVLTQALRWETMDKYLVGLSRDAVQPAVRAVALRTLIRGRATWSVGYRLAWVDKTLGKTRREPALKERELSRPVSLRMLIENGARDRSVIVRKIAADGLIEFHRQILDADRLIEMLSTDRNGAIRERIIYLVRARQE
jgi:hypothetical protein